MTKRKRYSFVCDCGQRINGTSELHLKAMYNTHKNESKKHLYYKSIERKLKKKNGGNK